MEDIRDSINDDDVFKAMTTPQAIAMREARSCKEWRPAKVHTHLVWLICLNLVLLQRADEIPSRAKPKSAELQDWELPDGANEAPEQVIGDELHHAENGEMNGNPMQEEESVR